MDNSFKDKIKYLDPISLEKLNAYKLLNRIDTKYLCNINQITRLIEEVVKDFNIQEINNQRNFRYQTLYFDTPGLKTYFDHHQGKRIRYKIRFRKYLDTGDTFFEIKRKRNYIRTNKVRIKLPFTKTLDNNHYDYIRNHINLPESDLNSSIWTLFDRITLAGKNHLERITIDTNIRFKSDFKEISLPSLSIIEVKREKNTRISPFSKILLDLGIKPTGFSKYIMGSIFLNPQLKHNRFKRKIVTVNNICYDTKYDK